MMQLEWYDLWRFWHVPVGTHLPDLNSPTFFWGVSQLKAFSLVDNACSAFEGDRHLRSEEKVARIIEQNVSVSSRLHVSVVLLTKGVLFFHKEICFMTTAADFEKFSSACAFSATGVTMWHDSPCTWPLWDLGAGSTHNAVADLRWPHWCNMVLPSGPSRHWVRFVCNDLAMTLRGLIQSGSRGDGSQSRTPHRPKMICARFWPNSVCWHQI